ncbi:peptide chain release factor N(5)-glutamine methyltransferase [Blautia sp. OF03-15BH]|uniref:peptide chain release factor N(5)-glutamine methyltransferase n=1 Tax=Blautia sp. OF03-15BH TaxID=2292287 RepID=UPI000E53D27A|nr:peptide chain release factor N(5)-glutamine methyltransferase [Blautia sp. OF03-15BH]RGY01937.1 peptide chain release factor N(5)-glutamine methyltransferase [Blautia sp. OF03-15BH]
MTYRSLVTEGGKLLQAAGVAEAELDAWYLLEYLRKERGSRSDRQWYLLCREEEADIEEEKAYRELIGRRAKRIPLQQITGEQEFMGFSFLVNEHVLIPRQDTETLVEEAMEKTGKGDRVLDMCTGSGCILLSLLKLVPGLSGTGADISQEALKVAVENGKRLQTEASFLESDLFEKVEGVFDLIVSNPPYIASDEIGTLMEEVRDHEPIGALDGSADGLAFYRRLVQEGKDHLKSGGWMLFEIGCTQAEAVMELLKKGGFQEIYVKKDLAGLDRVVGGRKPKQEERKNV